MVKTLEQWAGDEDSRDTLAKLLSHPVMQDALATMRWLNRPTTRIDRLPEGMTAIEQIALTNAQRAGGQGMTDSLMSLPLLSNKTLKALSDPSFRSEPSEEMITGRKPAPRKR